MRIKSKTSALQIFHGFCGSVGLAYCLAATAQSDSAFTMSPGTFSAHMFNFQARDILERDHKIIFGQSVEQSLRGKPPSQNQSRGVNTLTVISPQSSSIMPAKLAANYPAAQRVSAEKTFRELLDKYGQVERQFDIPKHDTAGAVAAFIAGSYMAYRNSDFPDAHFKPLVNQMRGIIAGNTEFAQATGAEKQEMYEQMAIAGMLMAGTQMALKQQPNQQAAANMKQAAKGYLEQFLKTDADRVQITANGLVLK
jgi:hypothetical protein